MATTITMQSSTILGNFILVTASFAVLIILIRVFAWDKITGIFEERANKIANDIDAAEEKLTAAANLVQQREDELVQGRIESQKIIQDAVERAKLEKKRILEQADVEIQGLKQKAQLEIEAEKREAQENLRVQVAELAVDLASKIILEDLDQQAHSNLIDRYLDKLGDK
ncbi:F0F1 ATP synthase subunit B [Streptococcus suis]|uniref:ATP synthase subunit b n=7 Tax=Streptococcus suis TaxID=1307 RepID=ATPF_STRS2|nr:F0F1 ATP synthase subunit B [Streptococcus suis]A4VVK3.1 RecName: Full=ATP synthase subunit b; AltName: Full=ATP synthase F(0) sector subunit b; AltName: Full=ATPase subunit I; AltName: Full=F-type ATPase subunit b; Short=F-ATPase subunit b [Streptococcus suis 05ZYH33]A4W1W1.1 RecName: Full=ATP synthase subunit b; AltName: Full=ATP synthase F(0) sector subunit b; AltName: Full=ATPase subunit I; AltName: Full=F-type ATPase subunit b; Short=F-ATPase subunit b [Streptococcus suis 98HAH33]ABP9014